MSMSAEKAIARLGIHRIETSNPFTAVETNCYLIDGASPTLIDTGFATDEAYNSLTLELSRRGRNIGDIKRIILTHGHADHRALAPKIKEESGAEVFCHPLETRKMTYPSRKQEAVRRDRSREFYRSMGVPEDLLPTLVEEPHSPSVKPRLDHVSLLEDGDEIRIDDISLRVLHTPGHSCGSLCLHDIEKGLLFTGDTLLPTPRITALLEIDMIEEGRDYDGLKRHFESLERLLKLDASCVLPGHGEAFDEYGEVVNAFRKRQKVRQKHILRSLRNGRQTLYQICRSVFLFAHRDDLFLALSEVIGNLAILIEEKKAIRRQEDTLIYYEKM